MHYVMLSPCPGLCCFILSHSCPLIPPPFHLQELESQVHELRSLVGDMQPVRLSLQVDREQQATPPASYLQPTLQQPHQQPTAAQLDKSALLEAALKQVSCRRLVRLVVGMCVHHTCQYMFLCQYVYMLIWYECVDRMLCGANACTLSHGLLPAV